MKKRAVLMLMSVMMLSFAFAGISLLEPMDTYNLGDRLYVSVEGIVGSESGNFNIDLVCNNQAINLVKIPARAFPSDEESSYELPYKVLDSEDLEIDFENLTSIVGSCQLIASVGEDAVSTKVFSVTDKVSVTATLNKELYDPAEPINIEIGAVKANGDLLSGYVEVSGATFFSKAVESGKAMNSFSMAENTEAGIYYLNITAYDVGDKGVLNKGSALISFEINQIPYSLVLSMDDNEVTPGEKFSIGAEVFDQSGVEMEGAVSGKLLGPSGEEEEVVFSTGESYEKEFATNTTPGIWKLRLFFDDLGEERELIVKEIQKVEMAIEDTVLVIKNVGNAIYNKTIEVQIGNSTQELNLTIQVGEVRKFNLGAPEGEYEVVASDGDNEISQSVLLTGRAISLKDLDDTGIFKSFSFVWIFLILVFGGIGILTFRKYRKTQTIDEKSVKKEGFFKRKLSFLIPRRLKKEDRSELLAGIPKKDEKKGVVDLTSTVSTAEAALVLKGEKYASAIVSIRVKNYESLNEVVRKSLSDIVQKNKDKGLIDWRGDYIFLIYTPLVSRTYANEMLAAKVAFNILKDLSDFNRKFKSKIDFNIGVNSGELVVSKSKSKFQYTGIGNVISFVKRLSDLDSGKLLVSESVRKKGLRDLKVEKVNDIGENPVFSVSEVKNKEANQAKLDQLLKRM